MFSQVTVHTFKNGSISCKKISVTMLWMQWYVCNGQGFLNAQSVYLLDTES